MEAGKERQERLAGLIRERKRRLWNELRDEIFRNLGDNYSSQFEIPLDDGEQSLLDVVEDTGLVLADVRRQELTQMYEAERRLMDGTYGICDDCGVDIDEERLKVVPFTLYCVPCQKRHEGPVFPPKDKL